MPGAFLRHFVEPEEMSVVLQEDLSVRHGDHGFLRLSRVAPEVKETAVLENMDSRGGIYVYYALAVFGHGDDEAFLQRLGVEVQVVLPVVDEQPVVGGRHPYPSGAVLVQVVDEKLFYVARKPGQLRLSVPGVEQDYADVGETEGYGAVAEHYAFPSVYARVRQTFGDFPEVLH